MARHAFLSFVVEDLDLVWMFRGQARNKNSNLSFDDYSVRIPFNSSNAEYIRGQIAHKIRNATVTVCLIGRTTHTSSWVRWEIEKSAQLGKSLLGVRLHSDARDVPPSALVTARARIVNWDIDAIVKFIGAA